MRGYFYALIVLSLVLLAGCLVNPDIVMRNQLASAKDIDIFNANEAGLNEPLPGPTPCACMYCDRQTMTTDPNGNAVPLGRFANPFAESSLYSGKCYFEQCNVNTFSDVLTAYNADPDNVAKIPRFFGYGQGGSFLEFGEAVKYCKQSVGYAGKWMIGTQGVPPTLPSTQRAACMLQHNVIPVYIYYTGSQEIDAQRAADIAARLNGVGPVIISTEVEFDPAKLDDVKRQVIAIKGACPQNCLVAVTPKLNDITSLDALFSDPAVADKIDLVGQGAVLNDHPSSCDIEQLIGERIYFSRQILQRYGKPSVWLYFGISPQQADPANGVQCTWSDVDVAEGYTYLFQMSQALVASGVIGVLNYQYADGLDPKPCVGAACDFGLVDIDPTTHLATQKLPQFRGWFQGCQRYIGSDGTVEDSQSPVAYSRNGKGNVCTFGGSNRMMQGFVQLEPGVNPYETTQMAENNIGYQCRACISYKNDPPALLAGTTASPVEWCTKYYPVLDASPDRYDIDPVLMRAIIGQESSFTNCDPDGTVSYVPDTPENRALCNNPNGYRQDSELIDVGEGRAAVDAFCPGFSFALKQYDANNPADGCQPEGHVFPASADVRNCMTCAMGMAQCIGYPGWVYGADPSLAMPPEISLCGGNKYNPFDPKDTFCCGAFTLSNFYDLAQRFVDANPQIGYAADNKEWYVAYIAVQMYHDGGRTVNGDYSAYLAQRTLDPNGDCAGNQNYVDFLRYCLGRHYAYDVMSKYRGLMHHDECKGIGECKG